MSAALQQFSLVGQVAVVTGAYGELGSYMSKHLARAGATVGVLGRNESSVNALVKEIIEEGNSAIALVADVTDRPSLEAAAAQLVAAHGTCHILVNAAGGNQPAATVMPDQDFSDCPPEAFTQALDLNLVGTMIPCQVL